MIDAATNGVQRSVFLSGKITGDEWYWSKFYEAKHQLEKAGYLVLNPAEALPRYGLDYIGCLRITGAMLEACDIACFLNDWKDSMGARYEYGCAVASEKEIIMYDEWRKAAEPTGGENEEKACMAEQLAATVEYVKKI